MNTAILGLGSNIEPQKNIHLAKKILSEKFKVLNESKFVSTKPVGIVDQPDFINGALLVQTQADYDELRSCLKDIECQLGRSHDSVKSYGPRTMDIDILVWNDTVIDRDFYEREFVKNFVLELSPAVKY